MKNKNIHNEDFASKLPKNAGFDVPNGYFDDVEDGFSVKLREELFPNEVGFEVPSDYFNTLEDRILSNVELPKQGKVISLRTRILRIASVAAAIALLFVGYQFFNQEIEPTSEEIAFWINENIEEIDTSDILNVLDENTTLDDSFFDDSLENNTIEKYLDENDTYILIEESPGLFDEIN